MPEPNPRESTEEKLNKMRKQKQQNKKANGKQYKHGNRRDGIYLRRFFPSYFESLVYEGNEKKLVLKGSKINTHLGIIFRYV